MTSLRREDLIRALPYARRYARAVTGNQPRGDTLVTAGLKALLAEPGPPLEARHALYWAVTRQLAGESSPPAGTLPATGPLTLPQRQLLLLTALEDVPVRHAAVIVDLHPDAAEALLADARNHLRAGVATDVLIIEDEPVIAMDLEELVAGCGHRVVGVASSETEAVELAEAHKPGLILADINLGLGGDGTSAVARILRHHYAPVIFVTAYPERLLTGEDVEPAFVIAKPFEPMTLAIATYQAVTGGLRFG